MSRTIQLETIHFSRHLLLNLTDFFCREPGTCLLFSGGNQETSRYSFLCLFPHEQLFIQNGILRHRTIGINKLSDEIKENPWDSFKNLLSLSHNSPYPEWIGFFAYEMGGMNGQSKIIHPRSNLPDAYLQRSAITLVVDHTKNEGKVIIADQAHYLESEDQLAWVKRLSHSDEWIDLVQYLISYSDGRNDETLSRKLIACETRESYFSKIIEAQELINKGELYQVNLSQKFLIKEQIPPFPLFRRLTQINPAPFSAYIHLEEASIVSSSPERFLRLSQGEIETRPIKGTYPRGRSPSEDEQNRNLLLNSPKEKAELLMITDLMRNDLGQISLPGSVKVEEMMRCETYENVFHLVSIIRSKALPDLHPLDIIRTCFPGGSITGCPKQSAIHLIAELEQRTRGVYTGAIGYITGNGDFDFNIAIRTLSFTDHEAEIQLGGAVVADSDPEKEYEETLHKGESIFKALGAKLTQ